MKNNIFLDEKTHIYYVNGEKKPAVSDVLKIVDAIQLDGIPFEYLINAGKRGTKIHSFTEDYDYGELDLGDEDFCKENQDVLNYLLAYEKFRIDNPSLNLASEEKLYSEKLNLAGTVDLVCEINGKLSIVDKKSSKTIGNLRATLQLNFYRLMWNETKPQKVEMLYILQLSDNSNYRLIPIDINEELALKYKEIYNEIKGDKKL